MWVERSVLCDHRVQQSTIGWVRVCVTERQAEEEEVRIRRISVHPSECSVLRVGGKVIEAKVLVPAHIDRFRSKIPAVVSFVLYTPANVYR